MGVRTPPLTLDIGVGETVHFNSSDLETGNAGKGLRAAGAAAGPATGDWSFEVH